MEHDVKSLNAQEAVATANLDLDIKKEEYAQVRTSERERTKGTQEKACLLPPKLY
jgi:hypothetical protein